MLSPIFISLYFNGRQKDYDAVFVYNDDSSCYFQVMIDEKKVTFEGGLDHSFKVSNRQENPNAVAKIDRSILDAFTQQMDRMFS